MATTQSGITAGKLAMGLVLFATVATLLTGLEIGREHLFAQLAFACVVVLLAALCITEVMTTPQRRLSSYGYRIVLVTMIVIGCYGAIWFWKYQTPLFYLVFAGVIMSDVFAQLGGRLLVKWHASLPTSHMVSPVCYAAEKPHWLRRVSPGKTYGGFLCGIGGSAAALLLTALIVNRTTQTTASYGLCVLVPVVATMGDLLASKVKRVIDTDDFMLGGKPLLRSHGGVTDRGDSHWFAFGSVLLLVGLSSW